MLFEKKLIIFPLTSKGGMAGIFLFKKRFIVFQYVLGAVMGSFSFSHI